MKRRDILKCSIAGMLGLTITPDIFANADIRQRKFCNVGNSSNASQLLIDKWGKNHLTYYMRGRDTREMEADVWDNEFKLAFDAWSEVTPLTFKEVDDYNSCDITINVSRRWLRGYGRRGGILASAQLPPRSNFNGRLGTTFDLAENWALPGSENGIILRSVACHEIGHLLGLGHTRDENALMYPYINSSTRQFHGPQEDDITKIQGLYGTP